ncbi:antistasin-like [Liolophura sinensis]|uniref:antistasin-like n=1 Tax=Liolophura sinensis TaxID=3198878 RepID=UPI0031594ABA
MLTRVLICALLLAIAAARTAGKCPPVCWKFCPFGNERDNKGCEICRCRPPPRALEDCPPLCGDACPYGNERDKNNCDTCLCRPIPTNELEDLEEI